MRVKYLIAMALSAMTAMAMFAPVASAGTPAPGYSQFAGCPDKTENPAIFACFNSNINGGYFQMGSKNVPITKPMNLSGGITFTQQFVYNSKGGLSKAKQLLPGGLIGWTGLDWLVNFFGVEGLKLYAVTELAGTPGSPTSDPFTLPIKVKLENPALGNTCYIGSNSNPITLNLTRGTTSPPPPNKPISGSPFNVSGTTEPQIIHLDDGVLVDNAFAAPKSNGCELDLGLFSIGIDTLVGLQAGLPAAAGTNATAQEVDAEVANRAVVYP